MKRSFFVPALQAVLAGFVIGAIGLAVYMVAMIGIALVAFFSSNANGAEIAPAPTAERVIDLPQDADKWFISVVGDPSNEQYKQISAWFNSDSRLAGLRKQVHFWDVPTTSKAFVRYRKSITGLPTVRVQKPDGYVVWEARDEEIPSSPSALYNDIAVSSERVLAGGVFIDWPILHRPVLPYRRILEQQMREQREQQPCPGPGPCPPAEPDYVAPEPPMDAGPPQFEDTGPRPLVVIGLAVLSLLVGGGGGLAAQWRKTYTTD